MLLGVAVGLPLLVGLVRSGDRPAMWAAAFGLWATGSTVASGSAISLTGTFFTVTGLIVTIGAVAFYAIGRAVPADGIGPLGIAFLVGGAANAFVAVLQGIVGLEVYDIWFYDGRATGLLGNPVFLGALCAAAMAFVPRVLAARLDAGVALAFLLAAGTQVSGTRSALVVLVVVVAWGAVRLGTRRGLLLVAAVVGGIAFGSVVHVQGSTAVNRIQSPEGIANRVENWREAGLAVMERPVVGWGPGRFRAAATPHRTPKLALIGPDRLYDDAHNVFVEYAVTTGLVGLALLVGWWVTSVRLGWRTTHPELLVAAGALLVYHLVEPQHITLTPLMLLLVGAAAPRRAPAAARATRWAQGALAAAALVVAGVLIVGDFTYRSADTDFDLARTRRAATLLWPWARPLSTQARIHLFLARTQKDPSEIPPALDAARRARRREPDDPDRTIAVAAILDQLGRHDESARTYVDALRLNPWSEQALTGRADALDALGRHEAAAACRAATRLQTRTESALRRSRSVCLRTS
ncbi:MAG: O-antigen ligase [Actinomycetota bacterium]